MLTINNVLESAGLDMSKRIKIARHQDTRMLSSVGGIYLIQDTTDGLQYVGSASGKEGILGRWKEYAKTGHGGNKILKQLIGADSTRAQKFKFTILQTLPATLTRNEVLAEERKYKEKLGSRAAGLNLN
ncbi:GIY-YIG nuclease family protein [Salimicrobium flavidum]|uniref:GIY-YIG catalytic domain-containing protein n=1 Tax=Salimicrobium flavidum TaxID=570947 RepID=A0A1N7KTI7_9BACI|nr:GIY-YIG nuclease family protein [Salimicrobium flavidum]SIS64874.1 GIY-YIG catalytic domain-containing protein [Salimicrobium flavidum]